MHGACMPEITHGAHVLSLLVEKPSYFLLLYLTSLTRLGPSGNGRFKSAIALVCPRSRHVSWYRSSKWGFSGRQYASVLESEDDVGRQGLSYIRRGRLSRMSVLQCLYVRRVFSFTALRREQNPAVLRCNVSYQ